MRMSRGPGAGPEGGAADVLTRAIRRLLNRRGGRRLANFARSLPNSFPDATRLVSSRGEVPRRESLLDRRRSPPLTLLPPPARRFQRAFLTSSPPVLHGYGR